MYMRDRDLNPTRYTGNPVLNRLGKWVPGRVYRGAEGAEVPSSEEINQLLQRMPEDFFPDYQNPLRVERVPILPLGTGETKTGWRYTYRAKLDGKPIEWRFILHPDGMAHIESIQFVGAKNGAGGAPREQIPIGPLANKRGEYRGQRKGGFNDPKLRNLIVEIPKIWHYVDIAPLLATYAPIRDFLKYISGTLD